MSTKKHRTEEPASSVSVTRTAHSVIPMALLDPELRERFFAEGALLPDGAIKRAPSYMSERIVWAKGISMTAWADREALVRVPLHGGRLTIEQIQELGPRIEHLNVVFQRWRDVRTLGTSATAGSEATHALDDLRVEQRGLQKKLLAAFDVRFEADESGRSLLSDIRKGSGDADLISDNIRILRLCNAEEHRDWLAEMPKGEAADALRLARLHGEFSKLLDSDQHAPSRVKDLLDRAWTLCHNAVERARKAGRYHVSDQPARKDAYPGFRQPKARRSYAKKPIVTPAPINP